MEFSNRDPDDVILYSGLSNIPMVISWKVSGEGHRGQWVGSAKTYALTWLKIQSPRSGHVASSAEVYLGVWEAAPRTQAAMGRLVLIVFHAMIYVR